MTRATKKQPRVKWDGWFERVPEEQLPPRAVYHYGRRLHGAAAASVAKKIKRLSRVA